MIIAPSTHTHALYFVGLRVGKDAPACSFVGISFSPDVTLQERGEVWYNHVLTFSLTVVIISGEDQELMNRALVRGDCLESKFGGGFVS